MEVPEHDCCLLRAPSLRTALTWASVATLLAASSFAGAQGVPPSPSQAASQAAASQGLPTLELSNPMAEHLRDSLTRVVLKPGEAPVNEALAGDYEKETYDLYSGAAAGANATTVQTQAGPVNISFPIPILQIPGMIAGGIAGATQREIQEFRDELTEDLAEASSQQIINEKIASDVYDEIRTAPGLDPNVFALETPVPEGTDAVLYVSVKDVVIEVDGNEAIITASVNASMNRQVDDTAIYTTTVFYQDRDTLSNWTDNDNAVWRNYANFARHYLGREVASLVFVSADVASTMVPAKTSSVSLSKRNPWDASSKKLSPTLAWKLDLPGADSDPAWASSIDESDIYYDLEIYDLNRPVYSATGIRGSEHTLTRNLKACQSYRWSVRPAYRVGGAIRYGPWMRSTNNGNGNIGHKASEAPAYLYDFASIDIKCGSK